MKISREWAMPSSNTYDIKPIKNLLKKYVFGKFLWIDPFANTSKIATITNDLNPEYDTDYHLDALDFMKIFQDESVDGVLYDPPYSLRQVSECYKNFGIPVTMETTQATFRANHLDQIKRILKKDGICISFGWNSSGVGINRGFEIIEILLVPHGGSKNDTIVTVEKKKYQEQDLFSII